MAEPFIVMCAPNGARLGKADHPNVPITPSELAECAAETLAAGASMLHLHVRDERGRHTLDVASYRSALSAIRRRVGFDLVLQVTSESVGRYAPSEQIAMIKTLRPEAVSIALREICPTDTTIGETRELFRWMTQEGVSPQVILYGQDDVARFETLLDAGAFASERVFCLYVIGRRGDVRTATSGARELAALASLPPSVLWAVCGFGACESLLVEGASRHGGHVRVGFENNTLRQNGQLAASNAELVEDAVHSVRMLGRAPASAPVVRDMLGITRPGEK